MEAVEHLYPVLRYVERNSVPGEFVPRTESWPWSSVWRFYQGAANSRRLPSPWPIPRPRDWRKRVNCAETRAELEALRRTLRREQPCGSEGWCEKIVRQLGLESSVRSPGRPKKATGS